MCILKIIMCILRTFIATLTYQQQRQQQMDSWQFLHNIGLVLSRNEEDRPHRTVLHGQAKHVRS
ncbi:hypothetical protein DsansV1_C22g0171531 [Dioscorea sansibarensis]